MRLLRGLGLVLAYASLVVAQTAQYCPKDDPGVCYTFNVPQQSASSSSGSSSSDIYFQIQGPASKQWIALGQSSKMAGSNMFVIYASQNGQNVTLSPRLGKGHNEPKYDTEAKVSLLGGSGIANGKMTANVRCTSCHQWTGGSMAFNSTDSKWIWASKEGDPLKDSSPSADIDQHNKKDEFKFDLTKATGGSSLNPFLAAAVTTPGGTTSKTVASNGAAGEKAASADEPSMDSGDEKRQKRIVMSHGILMSLAFIIFYPLGAIIIRLIPSKGIVWVHAVIQGFAYILVLAGFGIGVYIALKPERQIGEYHPIIGIIVTALLLLQPITGHLHHLRYVKHSRRTFWADFHVWWGRIIITLGIINGGLGLMLADNTTGGEIAYGVVAGIVWLIWVGVAVWWELRRKKQTAVGPGVAKQG